MTDESTTPGRRAARAILLDAAGRVILIKRSKPGQAPYWVTPGGEVEATDPSPEAALRRELAEELAAEAAELTQVFVTSSPNPGDGGVEYIYATRLIRMDETTRSGPEVTDPSRGRYDIERVDLLGDALASIDLRPSALKEFVLANQHALLSTAGVRPPGYGAGILEIRPRGRSRRRIIVTPTEIEVRGYLRRRRLDRTAAARIVRAILPGRGLVTYDALFVLDGNRKLLLRINAYRYEQGDLNRLLAFLGLPWEQPNPPLVTHNQLAAQYPGLVTWYEAHPIQAGVYGALGILVFSMALSIGLLIA